MKSKEYIEGFVKRASEAGIDKETALSLLDKVANGPMPMQGAIGAGGAAPDPAGPAGAMPPIPGPGGPGPGGAGPEAGGSGLPPELEQIIDSLPPEALQALVQQIEAELAQGGGEGGAGGPPPPHHGGGHPGAGGPPPGHPGAGGPPPGAEHLKQGGIIAKEAAYIEGFIERAYNLGFDKNSAKALYKQALDLMEQSSPQVKVAAQKQTGNQNDHYEGFIEKAASYGMPLNQANEIYREVFGKK